MKPAGFYLGTHHPHWLAELDVPLFVSRRALNRFKRLPRARTAWALDSGGFTELSMFGGWTTSPRRYVADVRRYRDEIGALRWAAPQDWMCEPEILKKTGLTVQEHQQRTLDNYLELCELAPELPWAPVLQGWSMGDYFRHAEAYEAAGVALRDLPVVGVGSVCRRQSTTLASAVLAVLAADGLKLHGFGFKLQGLAAAAGSLVSADSLAWSYAARRAPALPGHPHKSCANCAEYALMWRQEALRHLKD